MKCWHCNSEVIWNCDYDLEDVCGEEGMLTTLTCSNEECDAQYECVIKPNYRVNILKSNKVKPLPQNLNEQFDWAKRTLVGKCFRNIKTNNIYYVKDITIDTETMELRVVYTDGISTNDWDRPLNLFIQKFEEYTGGNQYA